MDRSGCGLPDEGCPIEKVRQTLRRRKEGDFPWESGRLFGYVYHAGDTIRQVALEAMSHYLSENALNPAAFPSVLKMEQELIAMTARLLHAPEPVGVCTSGGTESILLAMLAAREKARTERALPSGSGRVVVPHTVHPAFDKAARVLDLELVKVPTAADGRACPERMAEAVDEHTIMVAASAPCWPWGLIDPIEAIGRLACRHGLYFHVDACVGGMFLPFAPHRDQLPAWDFRVEGVSSISVDLHKYGYAPKGLSVLLYRERALRRHQYFTTTDWPGGLFATPALAGTRSAAVIAGGWAVMQHLGRQGYERLTASVMAATDRLRRALEAAGTLRVIGEPDMSIVAVTSDAVDLFELADELALRGWVVGRQQHPTSLHFILNPLHVPVIDHFVEDFEAVLHVLLHPPVGKKMRHMATRLSARLFGKLPAPVQDRLFHWAQRYVKTTPGGRQAAMYGMVGSLKANEQVEKVLSDYLDRMFAVDCAPSGKM